MHADEDAERLSEQAADRLGLAEANLEQDGVGAGGEVAGELAD